MNNVPAAFAARAVAISPAVAGQLVKRRRRDRDWHRDGLAEHRRRHLAHADRREHAIVKFQSLPARRVLAQGDLVERAAFVVIEHVLRQPAARRGGEISDIDQRRAIHRADLNSTTRNLTRSTRQPSRRTCFFSLSKTTHPRSCLRSPWPARGNNESARARPASSASPILCSRVLGLIRESRFCRALRRRAQSRRFPDGLSRAEYPARSCLPKARSRPRSSRPFRNSIATEGDESAWSLANKVATLAAIFMSAVTLIGILLRAATHRRHDVVELVAGKNRADDLAHARDVALHPARVAGRARHGNAECEKCFRRAGDGFELFQSRLHHRRRRARLVVRSAFRRARAHRRLAIGTLIGGLWQLLAQFPSLRRVGFHFRPDFHWRDQGVRTVSR